MEAILIIAVIGAVLGIVNTLRDFNRDRVKVRVSPAQAFFTYGPNIEDKPRLSVEITNMSTFPVTINSSGLFFTNSKKHAQFIDAVTADNVRPFPKRLGPRESYSIYLDPSPHLTMEKFQHTKCIYVKTACGETFIGKSPALSQLIEESKQYFGVN
ncbi:MAG: hypothetical protein IH886_08310 [Nitrospinae bacterium]|nr:hypothetical protein [Nitrospinota bacterium]